MLKERDEEKEKNEKGGEQERKRGREEEGKKKTGRGRMYIHVYRLLNSSLFLPVTLISDLLFTSQRASYPTRPIQDG